MAGAVLHPQPLTHSTHEIIPGHFHTDIAYVLTTNEAPKHTPDEGESNDSKLFTRAEIETIPESQMLENIREIILYAFGHTLIEWQPASPGKFN